jgi:hypothetical protein
VSVLFSCGCAHSSTELTARGSCRHERHRRRASYDGRVSTNSRTGRGCSSQMGSWPSHLLGTSQVFASFLRRQGGGPTSGASHAFNALPFCLVEAEVTPLSSSSPLAPFASRCRSMGPVPLRSTSAHIIFFSAKKKDHGLVLGLARHQRFPTGGCCYPGPVFVVLAPQRQAWAPP